MLKEFKNTKSLIYRLFHSGGVVLLLVFSAPAFCTTASVLATAPDSSVSDSGVVDKPLNSPEAVREMVSRLSDKEVRELLLERLDSVASEQQQVEMVAYTGPVDFVKHWSLGVWKSIVLAVDALPHMLSGQGQAIRNFVGSQEEYGIHNVLGILLLAIFLGYVAERSVIWLTRSQRAKVADSSDPGSYMDSLQLLALRFVLDIAGVIAFIIVSIFVINQFQYETADEISELLLDGLIYFPRLMLAVSSFLLAPHRSELRIVHTDDRTAQFLHRHQFGLFILMGLGTALIEFNRLNGMSPGELRLGFWLNLLIHCYFIFIAWNARSGLTSMLAGWDVQQNASEGRIAKIYPYFMIGSTVLIWLIIELIVSNEAFHILRHQPHLVTLLMLMFIPAFDTIIRGAAKALMPPMSGEGELAQLAYYSTRHSYVRIGRVLIFGLALWVFVQVWQIDVHDVASAGVGAHIATDLIQLLFVFSIGYLTWELVSLWINRKLAAEQTAAGIDIHSEEPGGGEGGGAGASRLSTILPLIRFTLQVVIVVMTVLIGLGNIGVNITPLLAGAGVVGIAIGFGAQKLVQDVVSGIFFLIDDAFRQGEYISIQDTLGTVEKISLRSLQLRHHRGPVHTIPYGEIPKLTNFSRDWVIMKLRFTVPFDTELNKVKKIFKQIGNDMLQEAEFKDDFLQPFKSQGVLEVNDVGIVLRGKFMAKPGTQFMIRKELYNRVQRAFDENGIQFARKEVRVKLDDNDARNLTDEQKKIVSGAAADAVQEQVTSPQNEQGSPDQ